MSEVFSGAQVLVRVQVTDAVSGRPLPDAQVVPSIKTAGAAYRPSPFGLRNRRDGWFVMGPSHLALTAGTRIGVTTRFRFDTSLPGFAPAQAEVLISPASFAEVEEEVVVAGVATRRRRIADAPFELRIALDPLPVRLAGQLVQDNDLSDPVSGATVTVDGNAARAVTTDADGRFLIGALPLAQSVEVTANKGADSVTVTHVIDFKTPTNQLTLSFLTEPTV
ncbi:MAG: hypothetical protein GVY31_12095 [Alphaproteobacteria bacterium]|jgi:hypothetical protein|nr:hypothetical protein [Alphaproteobacteria bacterium]